MTNWKNYPNFSEEELKCKHTGLCAMDADFMHKLQNLRTAFGKPLIITSGYRHKSHPVEAHKTIPGAHTYGRAVDISCRGADAHEIAFLAFELGFTGIGVSQNVRGARFIHLDTMTAADGFPRPTLYSY